MSAASTPLPSTTSASPRVAQTTVVARPDAAACSSTDPVPNVSSSGCATTTSSRASRRPALRLLPLLSRPSSCAPHPGDPSSPRIDTAPGSMSRSVHAREDDDVVRPARPARRAAVDDLQATAKQAQRSLRWFWPRAERKALRRAQAPRRGGPGDRDPRAHWPSRPHRLHHHGCRSRGPARGSTTAAPPSTDLEGMVKVFFADAGSKDQALDALGRIEAQASDRLAEIAGLASGPPQFPERVHLGALGLRLRGAGAGDGDGPAGRASRCSGGRTRRSPEAGTPTASSRGRDAARRRA